MQGTFLLEDVVILLKDMSNVVKAEPQEVREKLIKSGKKAYDTIPLETKPTDIEILFYENALNLASKDIALAVKSLAEQIYEKKGKEVVLVSLIRGGIITGILVKHYLENKYKIKVPHYALTLIGTKGIDEKALEYILDHYDSAMIQFIDGWTGKGAVKRTLEKSLQKYKSVSSELGVLSDPANILSLCGTHEDILISSSCLNAPLAGLLSRAIPLKDSFFGAIFFEDLLEYDKTYEFIKNIEDNMNYSKGELLIVKTNYNGLEEVQNIAKEFDIDDIHFIKPGMGETMRAIIRKKPDIILIKNELNKYTRFIKEIENTNKIAIQEYPLVNYNVCSIYKDTNSDIL